MSATTKGTWIILGATSAIARAVARQAAAAGYDLVLAGRDRPELEASAADLSVRYGRQASVLALDAGDFASHDGFVAACLAAATAPIHLFLAFAAMPAQDEIDQDPDLILEVANSGYSGALSLLHRFAPHLEAQGAGQVVVLGSVAGDRGRVKNYVYGSAKAGLHAYCEGLRARLWPSGVSVTLVKPGFIDTAMTWGLPGLFLVASPEDCAKSILKAADKGRETLYTPAFWWLIMTIIKHIPAKIFKRLKI